MAKYVQLLVDDDALTVEGMIKSIISEDSIFINEGRSILVEEFGKDYDTYFSILSAIASGKTHRSEIESIIDKQIGGYLTRLEDDYGIIAKEMPIGAKPLSKNTVYTIQDNFFTFWFRFIFKYGHILEIGGYEHLQTLITRDYATFSGIMLERYFRQKAIESKRFTGIGRWWDRKGEHEIDMVASNELDHNVEIFEIKRNRKNISFKFLEEKTKRMMAAVSLLNGYSVSVKGLDLDDM